MKVTSVYPTRTFKLIMEFDPVVLYENSRDMMQYDICVCELL